MANVIVKVQGSQEPQEINASNISALKSQLGLENYTATINGSPANDNSELSDYNVVHFSESVKGGK